MFIDISIYLYIHKYSYVSVYIYIYIMYVLDIILYIYPVNPKYDLFVDISRCQLWGIPYLKFGYRRAIQDISRKGIFRQTLGLFR